MRTARLAHKPQQGAAAAGSYLKDIGFTLVSENGKALHAACLACSEGGEQQQKEGQHIGHGHPLTRFYSVLRGALKSSFAGGGGSVPTSSISPIFKRHRATDTAGLQGLNRNGVQF